MTKQIYCNFFKNLFYLSSQIYIKQIQELIIFFPTKLFQRPPYKQMLQSNLQYNQYLRFFSEIDTTSLTNNITQQNLKKHRITILDQISKFSYKRPNVQITYTEYQANIVQYEVIIAKFKIGLTLINFDIEAPINDPDLKLGSGSFGTIRLQSSLNKHFVVKRQYFKQQQQTKNKIKMISNETQIRSAITQLCFYKICSLYKIGPAVDTQIGFDLLCYKDCLEFHLQFCQQIQIKRTQNQTTEFIFGNQFKYDQFERHMKQNMKLMHQLKLIHKDIKSANMLYSHQYKRYVFTDFGISQSVQENLGQKSKTYKQGTHDYMCRQMKNLKKNQQGQINLYENDRYGLQLSLDQILNSYISRYFLLQQFEQQSNDNNVEKQIQKSQKNQIPKKNQYNYEEQTESMNYYDLDKKNSSKSIKTNKQVEQLLQNKKPKQSQSSYYAKRQRYVKLIKKYGYPKIDEPVLNLQKVFKSVGYYQYLKLKYIAIKFDHSFKNTQKCWIYININQTIQILNDVIKIQNLKKKQEIFQILKMRKELQLQQLLIKLKQLIDRKEIIKCKRQKISELCLRNFIRIYGYDLNTLHVCSLLYLRNKQKYKLIYREIRQFCKKKFKILPAFEHIKLQDNKELLSKIILYQQQLHKNKEQLLVCYLQMFNYCYYYPQRIYYIYKIKRLSLKMSEFDQLLVQIQIAGLSIQVEKIQSIKTRISKINDHNKRNRLKESLFDILIYSEHLQQIKQLGKQMVQRLQEQINNKNENFIQKLALYYQRLNQFENCMDYLKKILQIKQNFYNQNHVTVIVYYFMATIYKKTQKYDQSLQYSVKLTTIFQKLYYEQYNQYRQNTYHNISQIYLNLNKYEQSLQYGLKSLQIHKKYQQTPSLKIRQHLSIIYYKMKNYKKSLQYLIYCLQSQKMICKYINKCKSMIDINIFTKLIAKQQSKFSNIYYRISKSYFKLVNYQQTLKYLYLSEKQIKNQSQKAHLYYEISLVYFEKGQFEKSLNYIQKAITIDQKSQSKLNLASSYHQISLVYSKFGKFEQGLKYSQKSLMIDKNKYGQNDSRVADSYHQISVLYKNLKKYQLALEALLKCIQIDKTFSRQQTLKSARSYHQASLIYHSMNQYKQSLEYAQKSIAIYEKNQEQFFRDFSKLYYHMYLICSELGQKNVALSYLVKSQQKLNKLKNQLLLAESQYNYQMFRVYFGMEKYQNSLQYLKKSISIKQRQQGKDQSKLLNEYYEMSIVYQNLQKYSKAQKYCLKCLKMCNKWQNTDYILILYDQLSIIYYKSQKLMKCLHYLKKCLKLLQMSEAEQELKTKQLQISIVYFELKCFEHSRKYCKWEHKLTINSVSEYSSFLQMKSLERKINKVFCRKKNKQ